MEAQSISGALAGSLRRAEPELEEVDRLIEKRARQKSPRDAANEREAIWKASEAEHHAAHREARRHMWITYYRTLSRNHAGLSAHFEGKASELLERGEA